MEFVPAKTKLEAVNRISQLTRSGEETLGPGSKERKSVLINLAIGLGISFTHEFTKQELASHLAVRMGASWLPDFESAGQTITLRGLNLLLEAASQEIESRSGRKTMVVGEAFAAELRAIAKVVQASVPIVMDGKKCVQEMRDTAYEKWRLTEWQGSYFELKAYRALTTHLGGSNIRLFNTSFDYARNFIWDLKAHSSVNAAGRNTPKCILNDSRAVESAIDETGLGFIVLSGMPTYSREFTKWHKEFRGGDDRVSVRTLKERFEAERLDIFFVPGSQELEAAKKRNELSIHNQGKNSNGKPRPPKYQLDLKKALEGDLQVYSHLF